MVRKEGSTDIVIVEDHTLVRQGIKALIETIDGMKVVAETGDGRDALDIIERYRPHVVFLDIAIPGLNGIEVATRIKKSYPQIKIIMLSMHANEEYVFQSLRAGVSGYMLKDSGVDELEIAIKSVIKGEIYLTPPISKQVVTDYISRTEGRVKDDKVDKKVDKNVFEVLTPRQREILQLIAEGYTTKEIAKKLNISVNTVDAHRTQIMDILDIHNIAGLVRYAIKSKLIE
ncbi:MAG: response regulator transcription factor [Syntrophorhabdaceae bacterium]|nr:response regulator transcription factor [Syntrophorhabdaceae bacterium]